MSLKKTQKEIMSEFYSLSKTKVVYNKVERSRLWEEAKKRSTTLDFVELKRKCPALEHQIRKSYESGNNIQPAVFSECVYAQTFANMLGLDKFVNCSEESDFIPPQTRDLLDSHNLVPRYVYSTENKERMFVQAGGCGGIDSALVTVADSQIYTIEFKEPGAKTTEADLPKYGEDGNLLVTDDFLKKHPQFEEMLSEQKDLNFFERMGSNIHDFSNESVNIAISNNYTKKYADVVCTEDVSGYFVMMPIDQISIWADIEGEIRPAGKNKSAVWTPGALERFLLDIGAVITGKEVSIQLANFYSERKERGGNGAVSGYKINPLFFIYQRDCCIQGETVTFDISKVRQLRPTIAGKMFFRGLDYDKVKEYYQKFLNSLK